MSENIQNRQNVTQNQQSGLGIAGMIIGIIALLLSCILIGGFIGIVGLILSIVGVSQKNKKTGMAVAGIVLNAVAIVIMIIMFVVAGSDSDNASTTAHKIDQESTVSSVQQSAEVSSVETSAPTDTNTAMPTVGEYVEGDTWKISLLDAKQYDKIAGEYYSDEPDSGNDYLVLFFEVENISDKDDYFNYLYLESYLDGYNTDFEITVNSPEGYSTLSGDVAAGKKLKGCLVYQVPQSGWSELEVSYKDWIATSNKVATFVVTPDNLSD